MTYHNGDSGNGNGNGNGGSYAGDSDLEFNYEEGSHKFTDPIRYYKSNDPYYWEVDNIPLKQLQENCLWLRERMDTGGGGGGGGGTSPQGGIGRANLNELQPYVDATNRVVKVKPGNFIGRVNDARNLLATINEMHAGGYVGPDLSDSDGEEPPHPDFSTTEYLPAKYILSLPDLTLEKLVGETLTNAMNFNGLYDYVQFHNSYLTEGASLRYTQGTTFNQNDFSDPADNVPSLKTAIWKHSLTAHTDPAVANAIDLQTLAVEFTKRWGGVARTAVVSVTEGSDANTVGITIPPFEGTDFMKPDGSTSTPLVRIDLVFLYTKPIDVRQVHIGRSSSEGAGVDTISQPQLGLIKGAGLILKPGVEGGPDIADDESLIGTEGVNDYYKLEENQTAINSDVAKSLLAPLGDQYDTNNDGILDGNGITIRGTFPSPDDLMNLAPMLADELDATDLKLVGQSVLPICYVISRSESAAQPLLAQDIIDIRPFLRTAELTYNERAGIAAANPPLSLANKAVGVRQLHDSLRNLQKNTETLYEGRLATLEIALENLISNLDFTTPEVIGQLVHNGFPTAVDVELDAADTDGHNEKLVLVEPRTFGDPQSMIVANGDTTTIRLKPGTYEVVADLKTKWDPDFGNFMTTLQSEQDDKRMANDFMHCKFLMRNNTSETVVARFDTIPEDYPHGAGNVTTDAHTWSIGMLAARYMATWGSLAGINAGGTGFLEQGDLSRKVEAERQVGGRAIIDVTDDTGGGYADFSIELNLRSDPGYEGGYHYTLGGDGEDWGGETTGNILANPKMRIETFGSFKIRKLSS